MTKEEMLKAIDDFANGAKLHEIYINLKTTRTRFNHDLEKYKLLENYARARELHGDGFNSEIEAIKEDLKNKKIDSNTARVLIDTIKWQAGKFYPKMYGDRIQQDITIKEQPIFPDVSKDNSDK